MKITYLKYEDLRLEIITENKKLKTINFTDKFRDVEDDETSLNVKKELLDFFKRKSKTFSIDFELEGTEFQKKVWTEMLKIPYGQTMTYGELAEKIDNPKGARAIGMACNKNKIPIIIPCHRVVGKNGKLTGFAGGLETKEFLLKIEKEYNKCL